MTGKKEEKILIFTGKHVSKKPWRRFRGRKIPYGLGSSWRGRSVGSILPNMVTLAALCIGLSSVYFTLLAQWQYAVASILVAGVLDGVDGRLARWLNASSEFGAELDSLVDFINFGVAPIMIVYVHALQPWQHKGWAICLFFSACMALRLARFNTQRIGGTLSDAFSLGVAAPAGALLILMPMMVEFIWRCTLSPWIFATTSLISALLLISRYPTLVFKALVIPKNFWPLGGGLLVGLVVGLISAPWESLLLVTLGYVASLPITGYLYLKKRRAFAQEARGSLPRNP